MFLYIIITTISLLERSDFLNFFISFGILILYFYDKNNEALEYLEPMIFSLGASLGYDVTVDTIDSILTSRDIYTVREQLEQLFDPKGSTGILYAAGVKSLGTKNVETLQAKHMKFRGLYNKVTDPETRITPVKEHSEKLLDVINKHQEGYRVESRARYQGNTMYSFVSPSYLGDRLETIQNYVEANDKAGLQRFSESLLRR